MFKKNIFILIISIFLFSLCGCCTTGRALDESRRIIAELERDNEEWAERNRQLEELYNSERTGNRELKRIIEDQQSELDEYFEAERRRLEAERFFIENLSGIFGEGSKIIEELIRGNHNIRKIVFPDKKTE